MTGEEFRGFAGARGLRGIGGEATIGALKQQYGGARWFDFLDVIWLPPGRLFEGLTQPWFIRDDATCLLPPVTFDCDFDGGCGGERNHAMALGGLSRQFGPAEEQEIHNVWNHRWQFGEVSLSILTFRRDRTRGNSLYARHPQLWDFCRVTIENPWLRPISEEETARLRGFREEDLLRMPAEWAAQKYHLTLWERGLLRAGETPARGEMVFWRYGTSGQIGWYREGFAMAFDRAWRPVIVAIEVAGERGDSDYSTAELSMANPFSHAHETVSVRLLSREGEGSVQMAAKELARFWGIEVC